jgi:hypothetical protein
MEFRYCARKVVNLRKKSRLVAIFPNPEIRVSRGFVAHLHLSQQEGDKNRQRNDNKKKSGRELDAPKKCAPGESAFFAMPMSVSRWHWPRFNHPMRGVGSKPWPSGCVRAPIVWGSTKCCNWPMKLPRARKVDPFFPLLSRGQIQCI